MEIRDKIKDIVGENMFTDCPASNEFINGAIAEVCDKAPVDLLIKYHNGAAVELNNSPKTLDVAGNRVLAVLREDSANVLRDAMEVNEVDFRTKYDNSGSSFKATDLTPVWSTIKGVLNVYPEPDATDSAFVYRFTYPSTDWANSSSVAIPGVPAELEQAILFRAAISIIQSYVSNAVQDDEDSEMQTMLNGQLQSLNASYQLEMDKFLKGEAS